MAFQSLYRKYRPQRFGELVAQEHVTTALRNAVRENRVGHAYLFSGPRGTGKTTTARILAKALNCLELGADGEPCGQCENCVAISNGTFADLIELDAASNRGVDDARDLVARTSLGLGATSKRKVYILDEAHMLTPAAANTLLKTLEEPPEHVVFALATTEPEKVLPTIRSRTQHFEMRLLTLDELTGLLVSMLGDENVEFEPEAIAVIARAAAGSARDALSLLDQSLAHTAGVLTLEEVERVFGGSPFEARVVILDAIAAEDVPGTLTGLAGLLDAGHDPRRIAEDLVSALRDAFMLVAARGRVRVDAPPNEQERLGAIGEALGNAALVRGLETLGQAVVDMRGTDAADPRLVLEIALVRLARRDTGGPVQALADRVERLEKRVVELGGSVTPDAGGSPSVSAAPTPPPVSVAPPPAPPELLPPPLPTPATTPPVAADAEPKRAPLSEPKTESPPEPASKPGRKPALGAFKKPAAAPESAPTPEPEPPPAAGAVRDHQAETPDAPTVPLVLDDVILAWERVLEHLPRSLRTAIQEAQPLSVDGNVVTFGVSGHQLDSVKPRFQKEAHTIREAFIAELGSPPRFKFAVHDWTGNGGPRPARVSAEPEPEPEPPPEDQMIELEDPDELVDAPPDAGAALDSIARLEDAFGATVVEEQPRT